MSKGNDTSTDTLTMDILLEQLQASRETNAALVATMKQIADAVSRKAPTLDEQIEASRVVDRRPEIKTIDVPVQSDTGSRFTAICQPMGGRLMVIRLDGYTMPEDVDARYHAETGMPTVDKSNGMRPTTYKQWQYANFWQRDLKWYVGKPIPKHLEPKPISAAAE